MKRNILTEPACLPANTCNVDEIAFRGILARSIATAQSLGTAPSSAGNSSWSVVLDATAEAAGAQCSGGNDDNADTCGADWTKSQYDGKKGLSEDLSALNALLSALPQKLSVNGGGGSGSGNGTATAGSGSASNGTSTSSGGAAGTSGGAGANASAPAQQDENGVADGRSASMFGLLGAVGFAVAFFL